MAEAPRTPPNKFVPSTITPPPAPRQKTAVPRLSCYINAQDPLGPFHYENRDKPPDSEAPKLKGGYFRERRTVKEWADYHRLRLASRESLSAGRPDPSKLGPGTKLPPSIDEIDRLLKEGHQDTMSLSGNSHGSMPKSKSQDLRDWVEVQKENADLNDSKSSSQEATEPHLGVGLVLPPPIPAPKGQQKADEQILNPPSELKFGPMLQRPLKGAALLEEMIETSNPLQALQAEEDRAQVFMDRLPIVQEASRRLQNQLEIHADEPWPLPLLPDDFNPFILEINATKIRDTLENCKEFAVPMNRESSKLEFLDVAAKSLKNRVVKSRMKSFEEEKKAREAETSAAIACLMREGLQEEQKELEDEGQSEVPSTPKSLFHSFGPTPSNSAPQTSQSSTATGSEDENSSGIAERWWQMRELAWHDAAGRIPPPGVYPGYPGYRRLVNPMTHQYSEGNSVPYDAPTASNNDQEMRTPTQETEIASIASENVLASFAPPSQELGALSVHDSETEPRPLPPLSVHDSETGITQSMIDEARAALASEDKGKDRETSPDTSISEASSEGPQAIDKGKGKDASLYPGGNTPYASQDQQKGNGNQMIATVVGDTNRRDNGEHHGKKRGLDPKEVDVATSLRNHRVILVGETEPKARERNPPVPQPENMPNTLTKALCSSHPLEARPLLTLTLERVDPPVPCPTDKRCILLKHFEVGLDGVEGICQGMTGIPETPGVTAERERRLGKLGTLKQGDGGVYITLKHTQQKEKLYGKGYWYFFGVKFKQTGKERKLRKGGKWLLFGAPIEAVQNLDIERTQENVTVMLGGGVDQSGTALVPFKANFKRKRTIFSRGGLAPMDIWKDGEDWDDGVFHEIKAAMANNGLRVGFLYPKDKISLRKPRGFPAAGKSQEEKKRKQPGPDMTKEETKAMEKSMKPKKLSAEMMGRILTDKVLSDRAEQEAAARSM